MKLPVIRNPIATARTSSSAGVGVVMISSKLGRPGGPGVQI
jgi:hypothetical protein